MKKIMILGGGNCQMAAVRRAKQLGYYTVLADYYPHPPAAVLADKHLQISTFDLSACLKAAAEQHIDGIMTMGTDQPLYTAAAVAEQLSLPFPFSAETALNATNKQRMKSIFDAAGIANLPHIFLDRYSVATDLADLQPPYVLKPIDSQGQRGIYRLDTARQVIEHIECCLSFSRSDTVLVEEYYANAEITVSGWVSNGVLQILSVTDRLCIEADDCLGVCYAHRCPTAHMQLYPQLKNLSEQITAAFAVKNGPAYYQFLCGAQGVFVNEIAFRLGGAFEDVVIREISGFSTVDAVLAQSLGEQPDISSLTAYDAADIGKQAGVQLMFCRSGSIAAITPLAELLALPGVVAAGYNYKPGDTIPQTVNATARFGHCVIVTDNNDLSQLTDNFWDKLRVLDKNGQNMAIRRRI